MTISTIKFMDLPEITTIANKPIDDAVMFVKDEHVYLRLVINNKVIEAISFYEEDHNILFNIINPEYKSYVLKYTDDIGILNHTFINQYINKYDNFFTKIYYFETLSLNNFKLPLAPKIDEDGNEVSLEERFDQAWTDVHSIHYIELIERVDGDLLHYPYKVTVDNLKEWSNHLWNMYSLLHKNGITYDDIKPNNIGYIINGDNIIIKMIDLESLRYVENKTTINLIQSGMFKTSKYYTFDKYLYDSVDILSMIFALFNSWCKSDFMFCNKTLTELLNVDCSEIEEHFFNFKDIEFCSNYKFCLMLYTFYYMTEYFYNTQSTKFGLKSFNNFLIENNIPEEFAWIISNIGLYIFMYDKDMLVFKEYGTMRNPVFNNFNIFKIFNDYKIQNISPISNQPVNNNCFNNIINLIKDVIVNIFIDYKAFINKTIDNGTFKAYAKLMYK